MKYKLITPPLRLISIFLIFISTSFITNAFTMKLCTNFIGHDSSGDFNAEISILTQNENWALWAPNFGNLSTGSAFYLPYSGTIGQDSCQNKVITLNIADSLKNVLMTNTQIALYQQNPRMPFPDPDIFTLNNAFAAPFLKYCDKFLLTGTLISGRNVSFSISPIECNFPTSAGQSTIRNKRSYK